MKITFNIAYNTAWGENLFIVGDISELGAGLEEAALPLSYSNGRWSASIEVSSKLQEFSYSYLVKNGDSVIRREWGKARRVRTADVNCPMELFDQWSDQPTDKSFYSSMFTEAVFRRENRMPVMPVRSGSLTLKVFAPSVRPNEELLIVGSCPELGEWDERKAVRLSDANYPEWSVTLPLHRGVKMPMEYKFVKRNLTTNQVFWDYCENRTLNVEATQSAVVVSGLRFCDSEKPWHGAGTAIPVFSIRTEEDFGVGDFLSLKKMVDWLAQTGQKVLQILPINDTTMTKTWEDSYPYNANSTFALHPMYLNLKAVGELRDGGRRDYYNHLAGELNALPEVDYERVNNAKNEYVHEIFAEVGDATLESDEFKTFLAKNEFWLKNYAAFCLLRDQFGTSDFSQWGAYARFEAKAIDQLCADHRREISEIYFVQYHLDKQLREVRNYAHAHNVVLKGDIPIGISRTSADAWVDPDLFNMDCQAGAPPDDFSVLGQNWGFPTYNWEKMQEDGFQWWKNRMRKMAEYFDLYRIDHILGFFRIWQIPMNAVHGLLGTFNPALPFSPDEMRNNYDFWIDVDLHTNPYIMGYFLTDFFGEYTEEVRNTFLEEIVYGRYRLKDFVNTQQKVVAYFKTQEQNEKNKRIEQALLGLIDDVLFIEDPVQKGKYHPRISAQHTYVYRSLNDYERWCFNRLYNDFFYHRHNDFWYHKAMMKLPALVDSTDMLVCGEDLGMIPDCVPAVMAQLQILSLEIQRMSKDPSVEFGNPYHYPYTSVCTTSTHDMGGVRQWWEENRDKTQRFFNQMLCQQGEAPVYAEPWICDIIISQHLESPAMLTILPLQDWLSIDGSLRRQNPHEEQINIPAISRHYWRYRMHLTVEKLLAETVFNDNVRGKIERTGRL